MQFSLALFLFMSNVQCALTQTQKKTLLDRHNFARAKYDGPSGNSAKNMRRLVWSGKLETVAQTYLDQLSNRFGSACFDRFVHNTNALTNFRGLGGTDFTWVGENWYSEGSDDAVRAWTTMGWSDTGNCSERDVFERKTVNGVRCGTYGATTDAYYGHYVQVMMATTKAVGCGHNDNCGTLCNYGNAQWTTPSPPTRVSPTHVWATAGACPAQATCV